MKRKLGVIEWLVHVILVIAIGVFVYAVFFQPRLAPLGPVTGSKLSGMGDVVNKSESETLVLALSPTCPHCLVSRGFYKEIITRRNQSSQKLQVIAVVDTNVSVAQQNYVLKEENVIPDTVLAISFRANRIIGVPTVMTLDSDGVIEDVWMGRLDSLREETVLTAIGLRVGAALPD